MQRSSWVYTGGPLCLVISAEAHDEIANVTITVDAYNEVVAQTLDLKTFISEAKQPNLSNEVGMSEVN